MNHRRLKILQIRYQTYLSHQTDLLGNSAQLGGNCRRLDQIWKAAKLQDHEPETFFSKFHAMRAGYHTILSRWTMALSPMSC